MCEWPVCLCEWGVCLCECGMCVCGLGLCPGVCVRGGCVCVSGGCVFEAVIVGCDEGGGYIVLVDVGVESVTDVVGLLL